jgi:hypothetical protein
MPIFHLLLYSCVLSNGLDGELLSKTWRWDASGFYVQQEKCGAKGALAIGTPVFSDTFEDRKIEKFKCVRLNAE